MVVRRDAHCYRCGLVWRPRWHPVRICARCKSPHFAEPRLVVPTYGSGLGIDDIIGPNRSAVLLLARKYGARDVRVFGSVARKEATQSSDVDILVDRAPGGFDRWGLTRELRQLLGREVDLVPEKSLHWLVQPQVIAEAVPL
jgi:predicted nucleotidyltransferase